MWRGVVLVLAVACGGSTRAPEASVPPVPVDAPSEAPSDAPDVPDPPPDGPATLPTPEKLYEMCEARVEGPSMEGECTTDADCATAGCAGEVCTTTAASADVMTTCEAKLCFKILDTCGCVDGQCSWSLKDSLPVDALPVKPPVGGRPAGSLPTEPSGG